MCTYNRQITLCKLYLVKLLEKSQVFWKASLTGPDTGEIFPSTSHLRLSLLEREWMSLESDCYITWPLPPFQGLWTEQQYLSACWSVLWDFKTARHQPTNRAPLAPCPLTPQWEWQGGKKAPEALSVLWSFTADRMWGPFYAAQISSNCKERREKKNRPI